MLHQNKNEQKLQKVHPADTLSLYDDFDIPKYTLRKGSIDPDVAYRLIKNELLDEGNARLNLATFCSSFMENQAIQLMSETLEKNAIDKSEYPSTIELENRCVNIIASLWHAPQKDFIGTSTVGSSEACMLAGLAMKFRWRKQAQHLGLNITRKKPNIIISSGYQVCWEKFCVYWDVELRTIPMSPDHLNLDVSASINAIDAYTIGVVGILGQTYTGDLALIDSSGYITLKGRIKDIIIRGGENIAPTEVEGVICKIKGVIDAALVGIQDDVMGEEACAFIICDEYTILTAESVK